MSPRRAPKVTVDLAASAAADLISLGRGIWIPIRVLVRYDDPERPFLAECEFVLEDAAAEGAGVEARFMCTSIRFERRSGQEIDASSLRIPIQTILRDATTFLSSGTAGPDAPAGTLRSKFEKEQAFVGGAHKRAGDAKRAAQAMRQYRHLTPEFLQRVARAYRRAVRDGKPPRVVIAETLAGSPKATLTARNWIQAARRRGYLGEAVPGKAGEVVPIDRAQRSRRSNRKDRS
jgi:hypothetical protein